MADSARESLFPDVDARVAGAAEPFIVPDVAPPGADKTAVWHYLHDLIAEGKLRRTNEGYWRV